MTNIKWETWLVGIAVIATGVILFLLFTESDDAQALQEYPKTIITVSGVHRNPGVIGSYTPTAAETAPNAECSFRAGTRNEDSIHPGNSIAVTSGGATILTLPVEEHVGDVTSPWTPGAVANPVNLVLTLGSSGLSSAGFAVELACDFAPPETTTLPPPETTTTEAPPETTLPPPETTTTTVTVPDTTTTTIPGTPTTTTTRPPTTTTTTTTTLPAGGKPSIPKGVPTGPEYHVGMF